MRCGADYSAASISNNENACSGVSYKGMPYVFSENDIKAACVVLRIFNLQGSELHKSCNFCYIPTTLNLIKTH
jgi:hypothetical protein